jgi:hypothetical protein
MLLFGKETDGGRSERDICSSEMEQKQSAEGLGPSRCSFYCYCISWAAKAAKRGEIEQGLTDTRVRNQKCVRFSHRWNSFLFLSDQRARQNVGFRNEANAVTGSRKTGVILSGNIL